MVALTGCAQSQSDQLHDLLTRRLTTASASVGEVAQGQSTTDALVDAITSATELGSNAAGTSMSNISRWRSDQYGQLLGGPDVAYWAVGTAGDKVNIKTVVKGVSGTKGVIGTTDYFGYGCAVVTATPRKSDVDISGIACPSKITTIAFPPAAGMNEVRVG
jgi:hypothetical protein